MAGGSHRLASHKNPADVIQHGMRAAANNLPKMSQLNDEALSRTCLPEMTRFEIYDLLILPADIELTPGEG
jgi:hypothetical protein